MNVKQMVYAGGDLNLATDTVSAWNADRKVTSDVVVARKAVKNILYTVANSNAINNLNYRYELAVWKILLIVINVAIAVGLIVWGVFAVRGALKAAKSKTSDASNDGNDSLTTE